MVQTSNNMQTDVCYRAFSSTGELWTERSSFTTGDLVPTLLNSPTDTVNIDNGRLSGNCETPSSRCTGAVASLPLYPFSGMQTTIAHVRNSDALSRLCNECKWNSGAASVEGSVNEVHSKCMDCIDPLLFMGCTCKLSVTVTSKPPLQR